jgi:hypothetical protein
MTTRMFQRYFEKSIKAVLFKYSVVKPEPGPQPQGAASFSLLKPEP